MAEIVNIRKLNKSDFNQVLSISDKQFGKGYLNENDLMLYLTEPSKIAIVYVLEDKLRAFSFSQVYHDKTIHTLDLEGQYWFQETYQNKCPIGVIKSIAVDANSSGRGIGTHLAQVSIEQLSERTNLIISPCWQQGDHTPFASLLEKLNFNLMKTFTDFWKEDSIQKKYPCKTCGSPPCLCNMLLYQNKA